MQPKLSWGKEISLAEIAHVACSAWDAENNVHR